LFGSRGPGRGDAQHGAGRGGRRRALVRREPLEAGDDGRVEIHPRRIAMAA